MTNKQTEPQQLKIHLYSIKDKPTSDNVNLRIEITPTLRDVLKSLTINELDKINLLNFNLFNDFNSNDKNNINCYINFMKTTHTPTEINKAFTKEKQKELNELLKKTSLDRYKVKSIFFNSMCSIYKEFLFIKDLLDKCKLDLPIYQVGNLNHFSEQLKDSIRDIFNSLRNLNFNQEISLKPLDDKKLESLNKAIQERITLAQQEREQQQRNRIYTDDDGNERCHNCGEITENNCHEDENNTDILYCDNCDSRIS
jgi:hypothetical protein